MNAASKPSSADARSSDAIERRRQLMSLLTDGEASAAELDEWLGKNADDRDWRVDCAGYQLIGEVLRGQAPRLDRQDRDPLVDRIMAGLVDEAPSTALPMEAALSRVQADRGPAANDSVFRWKMVAGVASLAAVAAVTWSLVGSSAAVPVAAGSQLAVAAPPDVAAQPVIVQTAQGQVVRDARLEQLMSEHRQFGAMSALQAPAGFLRNATYDSSPQR